MTPLRIETEHLGASTRVTVTGDLSEHADFAAVLSAASRELVFDLRGVRRINSCGVREWIRLMDALRAEGRALVLEHCSVPFVNQMNMIMNFSGNARVRSFYAPYLCGHCGHEYAELCVLAEGAAPELPSTRACPRCGADAEFDDLRDAYLGFLT